MSAHDDFRLVKLHIGAFALLKQQGYYKSSEDCADVTQSFNNLFSPRPLKELIAAGFTRFQTWPDGDMFELRPGNQVFEIGVEFDQPLSDWVEFVCVPILTPMQMGATE